MIRCVRLSLYFFLGFLLSFWVVVSQAETIPATTTDGYYFTSVTNSINHKQPTPQLACTVGIPLAKPGFTGQWSGPYCTERDPTGYASQTYLTPSASPLSSCLPNQNWTLSGATCTRPDCTADQVRGAGGLCECPAGKENDGGTCKTTCPGGYHRFTPDDGRCEKDCVGYQVQGSDGVCKCNPTSNQVYALTTEAGGSPGCDGGCKTTSFLGTLYCPKSSSPLSSISSLPTGSTCYGYGGRTGATCTPAAPPRIDVKLSPLPPPKPVDPVVDPTPENPNPPKADPKTTPDNNKDPVKCGESGGVYLEVGGQGKCASPTPDNKMEGVKVKVIDTVTTNPDGSKTIVTEKTTQTTDPVTGQTGTKKTTETVTKDASGNTTGTSSSDKTGTSDSGSGDGSGDEPGQCAKEPNSPMCKKGTVPQKGKFDDGQDAKVTAAKDQLRAKFAEVKSAASSMFSGALGTGGGSLPCPPPITVLGKSWTICYSQYSDQLSMIGAFVMLAAAVGAAFIVLRR